MLVDKTKVIQEMSIYYKYNIWSFGLQVPPASSGPEVRVTIFWQIGARYSVLPNAVVQVFINTDHSVSDSFLRRSLSLGIWNSP